MSDLIDRQAAIDALWKALYEYEDKTEKQFQESEDLDVGDWIVHRIFVQNMNDIDRQTILNLPSAQPDLNEWCTDCKEYDSEKHHCPRYNRVIREALNGAEPRKPGRWSFIGENMFECTSCGVVYTTNQLNSLRNYDTDPYAPRFCPSCGADMRGEQNEKCG